jgi:hypothetical protein
MRAGPLAVGAVDMIVGEGGAEVPGFVATKNEVLQLVRYWATEIIHLEFTFFVYGYSRKNAPSFFLRKRTSGINQISA